MSQQLTIEQLAANGGYEIGDSKSKKGEPRLKQLFKDGREYRVDDELIATIIALGKPLKVAPGAATSIKAVS